MSYLLYMLGRGLMEATAGETGGSAVLRWAGVDAGEAGWDAEQRGRLGAAEAAYGRDDRRWTRERGAVLALVRGDAAAAEERWSGVCDGSSAGDEMVRGRLLMDVGRCAEAAVHLELGVALALREGARGMPEAECEDAMMGNAAMSREGATRVQELADAGQRALARGWYARAGEAYEEAAVLVELLLSAHGAWVVAERERPAGRAAVLEGLVTLARLGDALLRSAARVRLAGNLAEALRERHLREDLAPWATGGQEVGRLLEAEYARVSSLAGARPNHAELWLRVGMLARALGRMKEAERALRRVQAICPHHGGAAARLAATLAERGRAEEATEVLAAAEQIDVATLRRHHGLAVAARGGERFDRAVGEAEVVLGKRAETRANLAFTLGMMGALDQAVREWKEAGAG